MAQDWKTLDSAEAEAEKRTLLVVTRPVPRARAVHPTAVGRRDFQPDCRRRSAATDRILHLADEVGETCSPASPR